MILSITNYQDNANKTTVRYHLTPVEMTVIKKTHTHTHTHTHTGWRMWRKGNPCTVGQNVNFEIKVSAKLVLL